MSNLFDIKHIQFRYKAWKISYEQESDVEEYSQVANKRGVLLNRWLGKILKFNKLVGWKL